MSTSKPISPADAVSAALASTAVPTPSASVETKPARLAKPADKRGWWWGTGRRKTAVARVRLKPTSSDAGLSIKAARKDLYTVKDYFPEERDRNDALIALKIAGMEGKFQVVAQVSGGGKMVQAQAIRLGIARALVGYDPSLHAPLREQGLLTRDAREVERKKYGQAGARRRFQFSKP